MDINQMTAMMEQFRQEGGDMSALGTAYQTLTAPTKTTLGLNQWVKSDKPSMDEFNEDNRIIDREISALNRDKANKDNTLQTGLYSQTASDLGNPLDDVTKANIFTNPPLDKMAIFSRHAFMFTAAETITYKTPSGSSATSEYYEVLTLNQSPSRAVQIATQVYTTGLQKIYYRCRHLDTADYSIWQPWRSLAIGGAPAKYTLPLASGHELRGVGSYYYKNDFNEVTVLGRPEYFV